MVNVEIDDRHPVYAMRLDRMTRGDRHVVENAESHGLIMLSMVTRGPNYGNSIFELPFNNPLARLDSTTCGNECRQVRQAAHIE